MILFTARTIKVLLLLVVLFVGWWQFRRRLSKRCLITLGMLAVLLALIANGVSGFIPPMRDRVILTAQGEKCDAAQSSEVYLAGYTADGNSFISGKSLHIKEGHWFWSGETYAWRPETDSRQPDGITRTVVIEIPVGWSRTLNFSGNQWRGKVEINNCTRTWTVDTYSESSSMVSVEIGRSATSDLILNQIRMLAIYAMILLGAAGSMVLTVLKREQIRHWTKRYPGIISIAFIALCQLVVALYYSGIDSFWLDELYEIGWSAKANSLWDRCFNVGAAAPLPIWAVIFDIWYQIAPYGEKWLLLIPEVGTALGVFFVGLCGREYAGKRAGIFAALFAATSSNILIQCSYEARSYGLYFASSALLLYLYLHSWRKPDYKVNLPLMCVVMTFFAGMHYHAVLYCVALFLIDAYAYFVYKIKTRSIIPYLVAAASYIPNMLFQEMSVGAAAWQAVPKLKEVKELLLYLSNNSNIVRGLFLLGVSMHFCLYVERKKTQNKSSVTVDTGALIKPIVPLFIVCFVVTFFVVFGNFISPEAPLWSNRYFCDLFSCMFIVSGFAVSTLCDWVQSVSDKCEWSSRAVCLFLALMLVFSSLENIQTAGERIYQPWRQAADWIYTQSNYIFNSDTVILTTNTEDVKRGWEEYYIERQGMRDSLLVFNAWSMSKEELQEYSRVYVVNINKNVRGWQYLLDDYEIEQKAINDNIIVYVRRDGV